MKWFISADVHGYFDILKKALDEAGFDRNNPEHFFVSLGDLLDRGKQPRECLQFINSLERKILIRGNHEDLMEEMIAVHYPRTHDISNGTWYTAVDLTGKKNVDDILIAMKDNEDYNKYINNTVDYYETKTGIFVHGWIPCLYWEGFSGVKKSWEYNPNWRDTLNWKPYRWLNGMEAWRNGIIEKDKTIYCGHWHSSWGNSRYHGDGSEFGEKANFNPFIDNGIVALDACTAYSKKINVVVLEED